MIILLLRPAWAEDECRPKARVELDLVLGLPEGESIFQGERNLDSFAGQKALVVLERVLGSIRKLRPASHVDVYIQHGLVKVTIASREGRLLTRCILVLKCDDQFTIRKAIAVEEPEILELSKEFLEARELEIPARNHAPQAEPNQK